MTAAERRAAESDGALVLDMDGVMVDSEPHWNAFKERTLPERLGVEVDPEVLAGRSMPDQHEYLVAEHGVECSLADYVDLFDEYADTLYGREVALLEGLSDLLTDLRAAGIRTAVCSSSYRRWIDIVLDRFDLGDFDAVVSVADLEGPGKPAPDPYLHAAAELETPPARCVAVEDSTHGVEAAAAAGYHVLAYKPPENPHDVSPADAVATTPADVREHLRARFL
jgi:HAD superfamily hydrolase (TIGR01509 family)